MASTAIASIVSPTILGQIAPDLRLQLLQTQAAWFTRHGQPLPADPKAVDVEAVAALLQTGDVRSLAALVDHLYLIREMGRDGNVDQMLRDQEVRDLGVAYPPEAMPVAIDVATRICLADAEVLRRLHAESRLPAIRSFAYFHAPGTTAPIARQLDPAKRTAMQDELDRKLGELNQGASTRVSLIDRPDELWIVIDRAAPMHRENVVESGKRTSLLYTPAVSDVLVYLKRIGRLGIQTAVRSKRVRELYLAMVGKHLFGDPATFPLDGGITLEPLRQGGGSIRCEDIAGIRRVELHEIGWEFEDAIGLESGHKAQIDLFRAMQMTGLAIPANARLTRAVFLVTFHGSDEPRRIEIRPPNILKLQRDEDSAVVDAWLRARRMVEAPGEASDAA